MTQKRNPGTRHPHGALEHDVLRAVRRGRQPGRALVQAVRRAARQRRLPPALLPDADQVHAAFTRLHLVGAVRLVGRRWQCRVPPSHGAHQP